MVAKKDPSKPVVPREDKVVRLRRELAEAEAAQRDKDSKKVEELQKQNETDRDYIGKKQQAIADREAEISRLQATLLDDRQSYANALISDEDLIARADAKD